MRSFRPWLVVSALASLSLAGCPDQGRHSGLRVSFAPTCGADPSVGIGCVQVRVCESDDPSRCVAVAPVGGPYPADGDGGVTDLLVGVVGGSLRFDVLAELGTRYDVDVVGFDHERGTRVAVGHASRVLLDGSAADVRLYRTDEWTCVPGDADLTLSRAFHQSVSLSNGDVLIVGGVTFPYDVNGLPLTGVVPTASLVAPEASLLVFDAASERLVPVAVSGMTDGLSRALFQARWIERTASDGAERVRLYGGVTGASTLTFAVAAGSQLPVRPTGGAEQAPTIDIVYHPESRSAEIIERADSVEVVIESERSPLPEARVTSFAALVGSTAPALVSSFGSASERVSGTVALPSPREGATITGLGSGGYLVYGGNRMQVAPDQDDERALWLESGGGIGTISLPTSLARSAIHSATRVDQTTVVFVGGVGIDGASVTAITGPLVRAYELTSTTPPVLSEIPLGGAGEGEVERLYHTATSFRRAGASRSSIVVAGGSSRSGGSQFQPLATSYLVDLEAATQVRPLPSLETARFGHSAALLRGGRVLVTGGLRRGVSSPEQTSSLYLVDQIETFVVPDSPSTVDCAAIGADGGVSPDAGRDAGMRDAGSTTPDAAIARDAGVSDDAGAMDDAAL